MKTMDVIKYLLEEIEEELSYNEKYAIAEKDAREKAKIANNRYWWDFLDKAFRNRSPKLSVIKHDSTKIRQLLLKLPREVTTK